MFCFFFKQKTSYEMRISDWSSDVCSSDLPSLLSAAQQVDGAHQHRTRRRQHVEVRLVATLRLTHVHQFNHGIDVREKKVTVLIGGRMPWIEAAPELGRVVTQAVRPHFPQPISQGAGISESATLSLTIARASRRETES